MPARRRHSPLLLALSYLVLAALWIVFSDRLVEAHRVSQVTSVPMQTIKGLGFVGFTSLALYLWARRFQMGTTADNVALTQAHDRSEHARRMYATLSAVNRRIIRPVDRSSLYVSICESLLNPGGFCCAWVGKVDLARHVLAPVASAGGSPGGEIALPASISSDHPAFCLLAAIRSARPAVCTRIAATDEPWQRFIAASHARACVAISFHPEPLEPKVIAVYSSNPEAFDPDTVAMLAELVTDLEHGVEVIVERERRTAAEAALRASEERYRLVAENSQDVIWILSRDLKIQYISPSIERLLGYTPAQMMTMQFPQFIAPESYRRVEAELAVAMRELHATGHMRSRLLEVEQIRADGTTVWTEIHTMDFHDDRGTWIGMLGVTRDITERRSAEQALASEIARCRVLLDLSVDGIQVLDERGNLLDANEIFLRERGFTRDMIPTLRIEHWNAELSHEQLMARLASVTAEPLLFEAKHRRTDGNTFTVEGRAKRVELDGRVMIYCSTRDISERRVLEQRLLRSQRLESVGLIASGIAHDLNNVLTPILLSTGLLEMRYRAPEDHALLSPIEAAARRGSNIVQQILTFARGAEGQRVSIEPKILLKELSSLIRETFPRNIVHRLDVAPDAWPVSGDPTQLHQVFLNLAVNARDAMPEGGTLTLEARNRRIGDDDVRAIPSAKPGDYVCIVVGDTGTGMLPDVVDHLFEPFFTTKPRGRGTGLGLSTVHGLVKSHGGFVDVATQLGRGSEFRVFLPAAPSTAADATVAEQAAQSNLGHGEYVLVVDDEPAILIVLASVLQRHGFMTLTAADGNEALALFDQHAERIALAITDVMMPKFDGVRLAAEIRRRRPNLPIVAMSGMISPTADDDSRQQLRTLGVITILDKPYGEAELLRSIEAALRQREPTIPE